MTSPALPDAARLGTPARVLLLLACALACVAAACSARDLWAPDEPRYGQVAREMLDGGDWLVPHVNGVPYAEKPPLYFQATAAFSIPFGGVSALTARLVAALLAAGAVLLTARLARRLFGDADLGATAACIFASTGLVLWNAPRAALDLPLTFFVLLTVERGAAWAQGGGWWTALTAGVAWGAAILMKGPMGAFVPPLALAGGMIAARQVPRWRPGWIVMPLVAAAVVLAWLLPALEAGGEAYADRLLGQLADRATGVEQGHQRGPFYYVLRVGPLVLPWTLHLLAGLLAAGHMRRLEPPKRFALGLCVVAALGTLAILTMFGTKRELYMLPALPFGAILAAYAVHRGVAPRLQAWGRVLLVLCLAGIAVAVLVFPLVFLALNETPVIPGVEQPTTALIVVALLGGLGLCAATLFVWRRRGQAIRIVQLGAVFVLLGTTLLHVAALPPIDAAKSFRACAQAAEEASEGGPIVVSGWTQAPNLLWYLDRKRLETVHDAPDLVGRLAPGAERVAVVVMEGHWERAVRERPELRGAERHWAGRVGSRRYVIVTNARE